MKFTTAICASAGLLFALAWQPGVAHAEDAAPAAEAVPGWFRIDTDGFGTQLWVGATHTVGSLTVATDLYVVGTQAEFDIGLAFAFGDLSFVVMAGPVFDFATMDLVTLVAPQLFTIYNGAVYFESWIQVFLSEFLEDEAEDAAADPAAPAGPATPDIAAAPGAQDTLYTRNFLLFQASPNVAVGPQVEATLNLGGDGDALTSLPAGLRLNVGYGENNTLGLFLGYEMQEDARGDSDGIAGRFTFIRTW